MLSIYFGDNKDSVFNTEVYFKYAYEDEWLSNELVKEIIKDVDNSTVIDNNLIESPVLGKIAPSILSGGTKTLMLILNEPENIFNASTCGDNCSKWLLKIGELKDVTVNLHHIMDFGHRNFQIKIANNGKIVHNMKELLPYALEYLRD